MTTDQGPYPAQYPVQFAVDYPDRPLNRLTSFFRIFVIIPIAIVLGAVSGATWESAGSTSALHHSTTYYGPAGAGGLLFFLEIAAFFAVIVTWFAILFTGRYPRGIFGFVEGVFRWHNRVAAYAFVLVTDRYPPFSLAP